MKFCTLMQSSCISISIRIHERFNIALLKRHSQGLARVEQHGLLRIGGDFITLVFGALKRH
jgi:hypothetical protein